MRRKRIIWTGVASLLCGLAALATLAFGAPKHDVPNGPPADVPENNGQVEIGLSRASDVLDFPNAVIGDQTSGSVTVSNSGTQAADFELLGDLEIPATSPGAGALADQLQLQVTKTSSTSAAVVYSGSLTRFNAAGSLPLGTLYPQQQPHAPKSVTLDFLLTLPSTGSDAGDDALQDLGPIDQRLLVQATQKTGRPTTTPPQHAAPTAQQNQPKDQDTPAVPALMPVAETASSEPITVQREISQGSSAQLEPKSNKRRGVKRRKTRRVRTELAGKDGPGFISRNGGALALFAVASGLLLTLTLPTGGVGRP